MTYVRSQHTIAQSALVTGFGYWSGLDVQVEFRPAEPNTGITFVRSDLGEHARIPARPDLRLEVPRRTTLSCDGVRVEMVEHVMAALAGLEIDNCEVWVDSAEIPGCDGSALAFVEAICDAGIVEQDSLAESLVVEKLVRISDGECWIEAHPAENVGELSIEYQVDYPNNPRIGRQSVSSVINPETFRDELAPSRTFILESEAAGLVKSGKGTRVTTSDLLVFNESGPIDNPLRFANECARHKALDVLGDLALTGRALSARIVAYRSGHRLNSALAKLLLEQYSVTQPLLKTSA